MRISRSIRSAAVAVAAGCVIAACGGSPTATESSDDEDCFADTRQELEDIYGELEGLSMKERTAKLQDLAADKGPLTITASTNPADAKVVYPAFTKATGVEVELQSADADSARARLVEEIKACHASTDVWAADATEVAALDREGYLLPLESPAIDELPDTVPILGNFVGDSVNVYTAAWNTNQVSDDQVPTSWEDVLGNEGGFAVDVGDYAWFATLVKDYFVKEKGMTEDEAIDLFRDAAERMTPIDGHTLMAQLLASGELTMIADGYHHSLQSIVDEGAPISWEKPAPVEPVVFRPGADAIPITADNLPAALLYLDWGLSEEHALLNVEMNRTPVLPVEGGIPEDVDQIPVSEELITDPTEVEKWEELWDSIVRETGEEPLTED